MSSQEEGSAQKVRLDLNNPVFQEQLFGLEKANQNRILATLRRLHKMSWSEVYQSSGLNWEKIHSRKGPKGADLYSFRISRGFRAVAYREGSWMRLLSLHPDHDSAYK